MAIATLSQQKGIIGKYLDDIVSKEQKVAEIEDNNMSFIWNLKEELLGQNYRDMLSFVKEHIKLFKNLCSGKSCSDRTFIISDWSRDGVRVTCQISNTRPARNPRISIGDSEILTPTVLFTVNLNDMEFTTTGKNNNGCSLDEAEEFYNLLRKR